MTRKKQNPLLVWERHTGPDIPSHWQGEPGGFFINKQHYGAELSTGMYTHSLFTVQVDGKNIGNASTLAEAKVVAECYARAPSKNPKMNARRKRYGETAWWYLLHTRDRLKADPDRTSFTPVQPYNKRDMQAVEGLIADGTFKLVRRDAEGRLYFSAELPTVLAAIEGGTVRSSNPGANTDTKKLKTRLLR